MKSLQSHFIPQTRLDKHSIRTQFASTKMLSGVVSFLAIFFASSLFAQPAGPVWIHIHTATHNSKPQDPQNPGSVTDTWSSASTWEQNAAPTDESTVYITAGITVTGASGTAEMIIVERGATLELGGDLEVNSLIWVRSGGTLNIGAHTLSGGTLRLGWTSESANLVRSTGGKIRTNTWDHFRTDQTMDILDRVENLYLSNFNGAVTTFTTTSRFNIRGSVWVERGGTRGSTTLELGDDLELTGNLSMREGVLKDMGYNVTVGGQITNGNSRLWGWNGMTTERGGGNLIARKMVFGRGVGNVSFRSCDVILEQFTTVNRFTTTTNFSIDQDGTNSARSGTGLSIENPADNAFVLGHRDGARDRTVMTLNWNNTVSPGFDWILRWKGNHLDQLKQYIRDGKLVAGTLPGGVSFTADDNVFHDTMGLIAEEEYTYIGIPGATDPAALDAVPELNVGPSYVNLTEGPTGDQYVETEGAVNAVMVFVDFEGARAGDLITETVGNDKLGNGAAQMLFERQSYGKMKLNVTRIDGWRSLSNTASHYTDTPDDGNPATPEDDATHFDTYAEHLTYIQDVTALFTDVTFSNYDIVLIVASPTPDIRLSPAVTVGAGDISTLNGVRAAVTFGNDSYTNRWTNLVHEMGHLFGLPDLYPFAPLKKKDSVVGPWDLMDDIFSGNVFLGWHRHKMGWLDGSRMRYLQRTTTTFERTYELTRVSSCCGPSMVVISAGTETNPSKVFVVELTEPVLTSDWRAKQMSSSDGVLIYSVDATLASGSFPINVYSRTPRPATPASDSDYEFLWQAPWEVDDTFNDTDSPVDGVPMKVEVLSKTGTGSNSTYEVKITVNSSNQ